MGIKISDKAKAVISAIAPSLGAALGGPFGGLAGKILAKTLGGDSNGEAEAQAQLEAQTPETLLKLKEAELAFTVQMEQLGITREQLEYDDRKDARARDVQLGGDMTTKVIAYSIIAGFLVMGTLVLFGVAETRSVMAGTIIGYMSAKSEQIVAFYFGSSKGSRNKDDALARAANK